ncbi:MAG: peptidase MA family metallohydrolase [Armatimonadota bacterium]
MRALLAIFLLAAFLPAGAQQWVGYRTTGAVIYVHPGQQELAGQVTGMVREELPRLAHAVGVAHPGPFPIYVYADHQEYQRNTHMPPFVQGVSQSPTGKISLTVGMFAWDTRRVVAHEMTHSLINQKLHRKIRSIPVWVNEGMADYLSVPPMWTQAAQWIALPFIPDRSTPLSQLSNAFAHGDQLRCQAAYRESRLLVAWLETRHPGAMKKALDGVAKGRNFSAEITRITGVTPTAWYAGWHLDAQHAEQRGRMAVYILIGLWLLNVIIRRIIRRYHRPAHVV